MDPTTPTNPSSYTLNELFEALESVDGDIYPGRKAELEAELQARRESGELASYERKKREERFAALHMSNTKVLLNAVGAGILIPMGVSLLGWVGYNYLVEMSPEAERVSSPIPAILFSATLVLAGLLQVKKIRVSMAMRPINDD